MCFLAQYEAAPSRSSLLRAELIPTHIDAMSELVEQVVDPSEEFKLIPLTKGKFAIIDSSDYEVVSQFKWYCNHGYPARNRKREDGSWRQIYLHHFLISILPNQEIDHINRNPLDNRRSNLRVATRRVNILNRGMNKNNSSGYRGVMWSKAAQKWIAQIKVNYKSIYLGLFECPMAASEAYENARQKFHA